MSTPRFGITAADLRCYDWQARLEKHTPKECWSYYEVFVPAAQEYEKAQDDRGFRVYGLLNSLASFHPNYRSAGNPYGPLWTTVDGNRALMAEDLTDEDLAALKEILEEIADPEFRARVGDVLWVCKRDFKAAQIAIAAFLQSAENFKGNKTWPRYVDRLGRAAVLAAHLGNAALKQSILETVDAEIKANEDNPESGLLCARLVSIALAHKTDDAVRYAALAEQLAKHFASVGEWSFSEKYWQLAEQCFRYLKNKQEVQRSKLAQAECLVSMAEAGLVKENLGYGYAAHWMGRAVEALRQANADSARITEVHLRFLELEKQYTQHEMREMDLKVDEIPGFRDDEKACQEAAAAWVRGYSFEDAVARLIHITRPIDIVSTRQMLEKQSEGFIWDQIVGTEALDSSGKVAGHLPPGSLKDAEKPEARKKILMHLRQTHWPIAVVWKIEPARLAIVEEHGVRWRDLAYIVANNPFIPPGHEGIYLRGIQAGFLGDWLIAMHLLSPQLEASIRYVLQRRGIITSTLESDGTQKERDLNQLLCMPEVEEIFGKDVIFNLRGILIERFGHNMRNESAHGLMAESMFYQPASVYVWWLILRLCWYGEKFGPISSQKS